MSEYAESAQRCARPLIQLAKMVGVGTSYIGQNGDYHEIDDEVLISVLAAMGVDASQSETIDASIRQLRDNQYRRIVEPTILHTIGQTQAVMVNTTILDIPTARIILENGEQWGSDLSIGRGDGAASYEVDGRFVSHAAVHIPCDLPMGYHTLEVSVGDVTERSTLISAPEQVPTIEALRSGQLWGWMAQLYSIRSHDSWGVGDFEDLRRLLVDAKQKSGADFVLINPLHAAEPTVPLTPSPYLPISRRFVNFTYIRPQVIEEYARLNDQDRHMVEELAAQSEPLNGDSQIIDRDAMWQAKSQALWLIFRAGRSKARQALFDEYVVSAGEELDAYAIWCLCYEYWGEPEDNEQSWIRVRNRDSVQVKDLCEQHAERLAFYRWLVWVATEQLEKAQQAARDAGMKIGVMADMAVGVHPTSSEIWWSPENFAHGATVGAPPDFFNQQGQDWSQPPLNPMRLRESGYRVYRSMVERVFRQAGSLRIDHILGLFRLWWIPQGRSAKDGAYVYYDHEIMFGILAIEASRAGGVVVGEDLGVVPEYVREVLQRHNIYGCAVEWFEQYDGVFVAPQYWREQALASVNTHDLPPAAGYLEFEHVTIRERLDLIEMPIEQFRQQAANEQNAMMTMLVSQGFLDPELLTDMHGNLPLIIEALHRALVSSPCKMLAASLTDAVGERRAQNQPGTNNEYPNWRIPLADYHGNVVALEDLFDHPQVAALAGVMNSVHDKRG